MEQRTDDFEKQTNEAYAKFGPIAKRYYFKFRRASVTYGESPCMIFLGNHSSGKSSLINWVLGGAPVQDVGLAPTDDGFTVIVYGETEADICGPAAISRLPQEFHALDVYGGTFLQHLKVKVRNRELLKSVTLIDSPGMIDSAEGGVSRTYDFEGVVRSLTDICDMIFFLLDPDKPGTTGETINVFAKCLAGSEFKLRVLLNKCDAFSSMYDFARTYGTTCWNLARVLHTKDLPKIWTVYSGADRSADGTCLDLTDFNRHREEFLDVLRNAAARRHDNVFCQALADFMELSLRMRIVNHAVRRLWTFRLSYCAFCLLVLTAVGLLVGHGLAGEPMTIAVMVLALCLGAFMAYGVLRVAVKLLRSYLARNVNDIFDREYQRILAVGIHDNLTQNWANVRDETAEIIRKAPLDLPLFGEFRRRRLDAMITGLCKAFHKGGED